MKLLSVGDVARRLGVRPAQITQLFYERKLRDDLCPIVGGRRLVRPEYVAVIAAALHRKGIQVKSQAAPERRPEQSQLARIRSCDSKAGVPEEGE